MASVNPRPESGVEDPGAASAEWIALLEALVHEVKGWAEATGWRTRVYRKPMKEDPSLGRYEAPRLVMERERDGVVVALDPVARYVPGADGGVDIYLMPGSDVIASLYHVGGQWLVYCAPSPDASERRSVIEWKAMPYSEETIRTVLGMVAGDHA